MVNSLLVLSVTVQFKIPTITKVSRYSNSAIIGNSSTAREDIEHIFINIQCRVTATNKVLVSSPHKIDPDEAPLVFVFLTSLLIVSCVSGHISRVSHSPAPKLRSAASTAAGATGSLPAR